MGGGLSSGTDGYDYHGQYKCVGRLGQGTFATVEAYLTTNKDRIVAVKVYSSTQTIERHSQISNEVTALRRLVHTNSYIIQFLDYQIHDEIGAYVVMEACLGGTLDRHLMASIPSGSFDIITATLYLAEMISALRSLGRHGVVHRDIKANNIAIDVTGHIKIFDFGCAKCLFEPVDEESLGLLSYDEIAKTRTIVGAEHNMSPEMKALRTSNIFDGGYSIHVDWYALGVLYLEMLVGSVAYDAVDAATRVVFAIEADACKSSIIAANCELSRSHPELLKDVASAAVELTLGLLREDPSSRLGGHNNLHLLLGHRIFQQLALFGACVINWDEVDSRTSPPPNSYFNKNIGNLDLVDMFARSTEAMNQGNEQEYPISDADQALFADF